MKEFNIGQLIKQMRRERNLSMMDLSKNIGISQPSLSRIERNFQEVSLDLLSKICREFDVSISEFFLKLEESKEIEEIDIDLVGEENENIEDEVTRRLHEVIPHLTLEQKKGLYIFMLPFLNK